MIRYELIQHLLPRRLAVVLLFSNDDFSQSQVIYAMAKTNSLNDEWEYKLRYKCNDKTYNNDNKYYNKTKYSNYHNNNNNNNTKH